MLGVFARAYDLYDLAGRSMHRASRYYLDAGWFCREPKKSTATEKAELRKEEGRCLGSSRYFLYSTHVHTDAGVLRDLAGAGGAGEALAKARRLASHLYLPGVLVTTQPHGRVRKEAWGGGHDVHEGAEELRVAGAGGGVGGGGWQGGVWVVGGWAWDGMVLLEGCVVSAMRVARDFGVEVEW
ncbi:uncharacterized protein H6S33_008725 [Morchella sextelata]|uniref:uncharacterized protein n=1 Tax=Morchella sextelata TaxID=1174677 RepID=UPI001D052DF8|nr:uncharacterized protein H6S33_008725 [Morchella sextelata]KAH0602386.1 hypothetical protein H6S33_008725 [Morchella sextelata]